MISNSILKVEIYYRPFPYEFQHKSIPEHATHLIVGPASLYPEIIRLADFLALNGYKILNVGTHVWVALLGISKET